MGKPINRFDVQIVIGTCTLGISNVPGRAFTPQQVIDALEQFIALIRKSLELEGGR